MTLMHHQRILSASLVHHQCFISASSAHHQRIISASSVHHQRIISASSLHHQCFISASSARHQRVISASSMHHQRIISASIVHLEFDMSSVTGLVNTQIPSIKLNLSFAQLYVVQFFSAFDHLSVWFWLSVDRTLRRQFCPGRLTEASQWRKVFRSTFLGWRRNQRTLYPKFSFSKPAFRKHLKGISWRSELLPKSVAFPEHPVFNSFADGLVSFRQQRLPSKLFKSGDSSFIKPTEVIFQN